MLVCSLVETLDKIKPPYIFTLLSFSLLAQDEPFSSRGKLIVSYMFSNIFKKFKLMVVSIFVAFWFCRSTMLGKKSIKNI